MHNDQINCPETFAYTLEIEMKNNNEVRPTRKMRRGKDSMSDSIIIRSILDEQTFKEISIVLILKM